MNYYSMANPPPSYDPEWATTENTVAPLSVQDKIDKFNLSMVYASHSLKQPVTRHDPTEPLWVWHLQTTLKKLDAGIRAMDMLEQRTRFLARENRET